MKPISRAVSAALLLFSVLFAASGGESLKITRIGKIIDTQGICALKPKLQERWTPIAGAVLLDPGDWLRTDPRGANALQGRLNSGDQFILGPGSLIEIVNEQEMRLIRGEIEITPAEKSTLILRLPGDKKQSVAEHTMLRVLDEKITELKQEPDWLKSFKGAAVKECMGSLLAKVDGRDQPLTIGYHKVTVDIRDQIARTAIEESFVNHTGGRLEGVFYFPLPQEASISGFGMWIGDQYVEADVVEKQRAREIYETILRERRDPGLLEWTGGNIFKARVFPIFPHSEKRIKITYTQVLPMQGNRYRYSYALQSEMLRQHSLRELALNVRIHSELPIRNVSCPTHEARVSRTTHSAQIEFSAQEYTPKRDFEVEIEADAAGREVILIPHQRGDDGYFLLLVSDPDAGKDAQRLLVPNGPPMDLIVVADTSASMDRSQREAQSRFISSLLGSLGPKDRCRLVAADVGCKWFRDGAAFAPSESEVEATREFLAARPSLGWTDMVRTFSNVLAQTSSGTQVVYVGDGIGTVGDANPVAIAQALKQLYKGRGTVHAVATGSSFEPGILKALSGMGSGSFRRIEGPNGPQTAAMALLGEIAQPAIRNLAVEFKGLRTARIYPEVLPNVPAGTQQIVLGRYLPDSRNLSGEVIVTGTRNGKPVRFTSAVKFDTAETGNDFIPRLWARMHLDALLEQGQTEAIRNEIIALSEEYNIMTPYTSLLVLESDEDRERFKVKRRFVMRDGERFFAEGRDASKIDLLQEQMRLAGQWRQDLRRSVLEELPGLGRKWPWDGGRDSRRRGNSIMDLNGLDFESSFGAVHKRLRVSDGDLNEYMQGSLQMMPSGDERRKDAYLDEWFDDDAATPRQTKEKSFDELAFTEKLPEAGQEEYAGFGPISWGFGSGSGSGSGIGPGFGGLDFRWTVATAFSVDAEGTLFHEILPPLPAPPVDSAPKPGKTAWSEDALRLSDSLIRQPILDAMAGGIDIDLKYSSRNPSTGDVTFESRLKMLYSPKAWISESTGDRNRTLTDWATEAARAVVCEAMQLGRQRKAQKADLKLQMPRFSYYLDNSLTPLAQNNENQIPTLKTDDKGNILLSLRYPTAGSDEQRFLIDPRRRVLLRREYWSKGKITSQTTFEKFVEVAGCWWATKITATDAESRVTGSTVASIKAINARAFEMQFQQALPNRNRAPIIQEPLPKVAAARQALSEKHASFEDLLALILHYSRSQQWEQVNSLWQNAEMLVKDKPGAEWIKDVILLISRRNEGLSQRCLARAKRFVQDKPLDDLFLCTRLQNLANRVMQTNEQLMLLETLRPVFERQIARLHTDMDWKKQHAQLLQWAGRREEAAGEWKALSKEFPKDTDIQSQYVNAMAEAGELPGAMNSLKPLLSNPNHWTMPERDMVRNVIANQMRHHSPAAEWQAFLEEWLANKTTYQQAYEYYLQSLIRTHQMDEANALISQWCEEGVKENRDELKPEDRQIQTARLQAAVRIALGDSIYPDGSRPYYEKRYSLLAAVVKETYRSTALRDVASQIMNHYQFQKSEAAADLRRTFVDVLLKEPDALDSRNIELMLSWLQSPDPPLKDETRREIVRAVTLRWERKEKAPLPFNLGQSIVRFLQSSSNQDELLAFLRRRAQSTEESADLLETYKRQLFNTLLAQRWSIDLEIECFSLLGRLNSSTETEQRLAVAIPALYRLVDSMLGNRYKEAFDAVPGKEAMSRTEYKSLQREKREEAANGLIKRLAEEAQKQDAALSPWLAIERITLATKQKQDAHTLAGECLEILGAEPALEDEQTLMQRHLADRCITTLIFLAARQARDEKPAAQALHFIDKGIERNPDPTYWKYQKYRLLVALDRPAELQKALETWTKSAIADDRWRVALGYLMAEQNRIQDAIRLFEAVKSSSELGPAELRSLADWHLVQGRKDRYEEERIAAWMAEGEYQLQNRLQRILQPWYNQQSSMPHELDPEVFRIFGALFRKGQQPQYYVGRLNEFYRQTHDFRLLECLAEGMLGHSHQQVYEFAMGFKGLMGEVRDEATVDGIIKYLLMVRKRDLTPIDRRALDILELHAERRAAELVNQPGPHAEAALAAMKRAFKGSWAPGERRLLADMLANLGRINGDELAREHLRQLTELHKSENQEAEDRLHIAQRLAETQWAYELKNDALITLEAALAQYREKNKGALPATANPALARFMEYLKEARHFAQAEQYLQNEMKHPANAQQAYWMQERRFEVYIAVLSSKGTVSFGSGEALYAETLKLFIDQMKTDDPNYRKQLIPLIGSFFRTAGAGEIEPVGLRKFAFETFPEFLARETDPNFYNEAVGNLAVTLHDLLGARTGLEFLIERLEKEPDWVQSGNRSSWQYHDGHLAEWRKESRDPGDLSDRLLRLATEALKRNLRSSSQNSLCLYYSGCSNFWSEKTKDFLAAANQVWDEERPSGAAAKSIGYYLHFGLGKTARAIAILDEAWRAGRLDESGLSQLAEYQHNIGEFEASIPVLGELIETRPDTISYRTRLMLAYYKTDRAGKLRNLLAETDKRFHEKGLWQENNIAALAGGCLDAHLYKESAAYYNELIPLHQRTQPNRETGDSTLSTYYMQLSQAHAALGQTAEAVEAASGAVVCWGLDNYNRSNALYRLQNALSQARDLDSYVEYLDRKAQETGLENPIVQQALGQVYLDRKEYNKAITHLRIAAKTQPNDHKTHELLIQAYDLAKNPEGALRQLLESADLSRRDINLYRSLGDRYKTRERPDDAERAYTSIVEMQPNESEGHTMLAEIRQSQNRWPEAIEQWKQVAKIRTLEPTGFLRLAEAQVHEKLWEDARQTIDTLLHKDWPERFGNVHQQAQSLKARLR